MAQWIVEINMLHIFREVLLPAIAELCKVMLGAEAANKLETVATVAVSIIVLHTDYNREYK